MFSWLHLNKCCQTVYRQQFGCQLWRTNNHATYRMLQHNAVQTAKVENNSNSEMTSLKSRISNKGYVNHNFFSGKLSAMSVGAFEQDEAVFLIDCCRRSLVGFNSNNASSIRINLGDNIMNASDKTTQVYNALIQLYIENGHKFSPEKILQEMIDNGVSANASTYSKLVCAHVINDELKAAENLVEKMKENEFPLSAEVRSCLLVGKLKAGENNVDFDGSVKINDHVFTLLCCQFCRSGDAEMLQKFFSFVKTENNLDGYHFVEIIQASLNSSNPVSMVDEMLPFLNNKLTHQELNYIIHGVSRYTGSGQVLKSLLKHFNVGRLDHKPLIHSIYKSSSGANLMDEIQYLQENLTKRKTSVLVEALKHSCRNEQNLSKKILLEMKRQGIDINPSLINAVYKSSKEDPEKFNEFLSENSFDEKLFIPGKETKLEAADQISGDPEHQVIVSNEKNLKEAEPLLGEAISSLQSKKNTAGIAQSIMTMRREFPGHEESFDKMVLDKLVNKMNSMRYFTKNWFNDRLKKFMVELRELGFKSISNPSYYIYKSLDMKHHSLANVLLLDGEKLQKWNPNSSLFGNKKTAFHVQEIVQKGGIDALLKSITEYLNSHYKPAAKSNKYLQCVVQDSLRHLEADDRTAVFKLLLEKCSPLSADIANVMLWHFVEMGDSETVAHLQGMSTSDGFEIGKTLRRFYRISYIPEKLLLSEDENVQAALRLHLTTTYSENKADWIYYASFLLSGNVDKCPKELVERLEWPGNMFYQSLFISPTVVDCLPDFINNLTEACSRFENWSRGELVIQCFSSFFRRGMLAEAEKLVESLEEDNWELTGKLKAAIVEKFHQADRKLPKSFQVSDTYRKIESFTSGGKDFLEMLLLVLNPPLSIGGPVSPAIVGNFFAKLSPEQLEVLDGVLRRSNSKLDPYRHPKVMEARLTTLLDQRRFEESFDFLKASAKKVGNVDKEFWPRILSMFGKHALAENDMNLVRKLYTANLNHGVTRRANYQLFYCKLKAGECSVDELLESNFTKFRELNEVIVFENDTELIAQIYKGVWDSYESTGVAKPLYDFTAALLVHGYTDPCIVDNLNRMRETCGVSVTIFGKSMMRAKDLNTLTNICRLLKEFSPSSAGEITVLNHQLMRSCLQLAPTLNRGDKIKLLDLFESSFFHIPHYFNAHETREALPVLRHCLKFDTFPEGLDRVGIVIAREPVNKNPLFEV